MYRLARQAWHLYREADADSFPHVVRPAIPILFFGDYKRYRVSPIRIITVGLNPSHSEFPVDRWSRRFPAAADLVDADHDGKFAAYLDALSAYFCEDPYRGWFDASFEKVLSGMKASYYEGATNSALHTDICSPLATSPTWTNLKRPEQDALGAGGINLWHDLVNRLDPDIVLFSIRRAYLDRIKFSPVCSWETVYTLKRKNPYHVESARFRLATGKPSLFIWGRAAQKPFGSVKHTIKREIGARTLQLHNDGWMG